MSKLADRTPARPVATSPIKTTKRFRATAEGGDGYAPKAKGELFKLAVSMLAGEDTFYESGEDRLKRLGDLVEKVTVSDPDWVALLIPFVRDQMNLRTVAIALAVEAVLARRKHVEVVAEKGSISTRQVVNNALSRVDEMGEFIAYFAERTGREPGAAVTLPGGVQRGLSDACQRLLTEYAAMKYDGLGKLWRLGDVVELVHPESSSAEQGALYEYLLDRRHHSGQIRADLELLPMIAANRRLNEMPVEQRRGYLNQPTALAELRAAGITWEAMSGWVQGELDASFWEAVIPQMGYMGLVRNLRNFDEVGISRAMVHKVQERLEDPQQVARSRQLPFRFWSAYRELNSLTWGDSLEVALDLTLSNIPHLDGRTLVVLDTSASMRERLSAKTEIRSIDVSALFALALVKANDADLVIFGDYSHPVEGMGRRALLLGMRQIDELVGSVGHGTRAHEAIANNFRAGVHDRVFVLTDEQAFRSCLSAQQAVPANVPVYTVNVQGYRAQMLPSGTEKSNRHVLAGLNDTTFQMVPLLETGENALWPWEMLRG